MRYLSGIPGLVLQRSCEDIVTQVEDKEANDEQRTHERPHSLPVPVECAARHGLKVTFKSVWITGRASLGLLMLWREGLQFACWLPVMFDHDPVSI